MNVATAPAPEFIEPDAHEDIPSIKESDFMVPQRRGLPLSLVIVLLVVVSIISAGVGVMLAIQRYSSAMNEQQSNLDMITEIVNNDDISDADKLEVMRTVIDEEVDSE